jgi:hypothetical protein
MCPSRRSPESPETENNRTADRKTSEQQKQEKPKKEWFEHTKVRKIRSWEVEKISNEEEKRDLEA